jgi:hypothetical protein
MAKISVQQRRILAGQCPRCGKEAAPYRLCYDHRQEVRLIRCLKKGARVGALSQTWDHRYSIVKNPDPGANRKWSKNSTLVALPESDGRSRPRLRGISVDVEAILLRVIENIGRPCTIEEIKQAWGRLRSKRSASLSTDLSVIIAASDKRKRKMEKRALSGRAK